MSGEIGRVSATAAALDESLPIPAPIIATLIAARFGLGGTYAVLGALLIIVGAVLLIVRRVDPLDTTAAADEQSSDVLQRAALSCR